MRTRCLGGFFVMWVTRLLISPVKKRIFCSKTTKFSPVGGMAGGCGAGCISQDTYLLYINVYKYRYLFKLVKGSWTWYICNVFVSGITNDSATSARIWSIHLFHGVLKATLHLRRIAIAGVLVDKVNTHWKHHEKRQRVNIFIVYLYTLMKSFSNSALKKSTL